MEAVGLENAVTFLPKNITQCLNEWPYKRSQIEVKTKPFTIIIPRVVISKPRILYSLKQRPTRSSKIRNLWKRNFLPLTKTQETILKFNRLFVALFKTILFKVTTPKSNTILPSLHNWAHCWSARPKICFYCDNKLKTNWIRIHQRTSYIGQKPLIWKNRDRVPQPNAVGFKADI